MKNVSVWVVPGIISAVLVSGSIAQTAYPGRVPVGLWKNATETTIGKTGEWSNKIEPADNNGDGLLDILFANGGNSKRNDSP